MKTGYLNAVYTNLILERDYEPVKTVDSPVVLREEARVLQKYRQEGIYSLIELTDGDWLNAVAIGEKLAAVHERLRNAGPGQIIHFILVLVFNRAPDEEKMNIITTASGYQNPTHGYLSLFTVNLEKREVVYHSRTGAPVDGLDKLLQRFLYTPTNEYESLPDINLILARKAAEYTIEFKAQKPAVTYFLIGINLAVWFFLYMVSLAFNASFDLLLSLGWKDNAAIIGGQYYRLLTPVFLHAGPVLGFPVSVHLLVNCYSLNVLGQYVERIFGHYKFLISYLAAGIIGNIVSFAFSPYPAVGASGAIFGLLGAILYYGLENPKVFKKYFGANVIATIVLNVMIGFSLAGLIDNFAHLGGLAGGFLTAGVVRVKASPAKFPGRYLFLAAALLLVALGLYYGFHHWGQQVLRITWAL